MRTAVEQVPSEAASQKRSQMGTKDAVQSAKLMLCVGAVEGNLYGGVRMDVPQGAEVCHISRGSSRYYTCAETFACGAQCSQVGA